MTAIRNLDRMRQPLDFAGLRYGWQGRIYPTDVDAILEWKDKGYILVEAKHRDTEVKPGQRLALERMVRDFSLAGKYAIALVVSHTEDDVTKPVDVGTASVTEVLTTWTVYDKETGLPYDTPHWMPGSLVQSSLPTVRDYFDLITEQLGDTMWTGPVRSL